MPLEVEIALYRPRAGREEDVRRCLREHVETLQRQGLVSERPALFLRSFRDGTYIEIFEWVSSEAIEQAHTDPVVRATWHRLAECAEYTNLASLQEAGELFPHFEPL
jgi:hypothetical protein